MKPIERIRLLRKLKGGVVRTRAERRRRGFNITPELASRSRNLILQSTRSRFRNTGEAREFARHSFKNRRQQRRAAQRRGRSSSPQRQSRRRRRREDSGDRDNPPDMGNNSPSPPRQRQQQQQQQPVPILLPRDLPPPDRPPAALPPPRNNFYILPFEVMQLLQPHVDANNFFAISDLDQDLDLHGMLDPNGHVYVMTNSERRDDPVRFAKLEYARLLLERNTSFYPHLIKPVDNDGILKKIISIPTRDVRDLPLYLALYILQRLQALRKRGVDDAHYEIEYRFGDHQQARFPIHLPNGDPLVLPGGEAAKISIDHLNLIYFELMKQFASLLPQQAPDNGIIMPRGADSYNVTWNGSEHSGTRIMLRHYMDRVEPITFKLTYRRVNNPLPPGYHWTPQIEDLLQKTVQTAVLSVRNRRDNKCLLYCIIMGLITKLKDTSARIFGLSTMMVEDYEIYAKGLHLFTDSSESSTEIRRLSKYLVPRSPLDPPDEFADFIENLDKKACAMTTVQSFRAGFEEIEDKLLPTHIVGIDVYGIDFNLSRHIYPLYATKHRENKVIELLCVTPPKADFSHYCLIMNMEKLLKNSGGKQFFSCSKCGLAFYHKHLLQSHDCRLAPGYVEGGYHFSRSGDDVHVKPICGSCPKCRLHFTNEFRYNYHKEHCLMKGYSGYRHVQLISYGDNTHPKLNGSPLDMNVEDKHVKQRRLMYADFESSIDPNTGEHTFMSYGIYEWQKDIYKCGYNLDELFDFILENAYDNPEEHIYVYFHNAMGYDANFILRYVLQTKRCENWGIQVIMKSSSRLQKLVFYTTDGKRSRSIHICDTFLFLTLSLERIVGSIRKNDNLDLNKENFKRFFGIFHRRYPGVADLEIDHILRKNIFPYKFFDSSARLSTPISEFLSIFEANSENLKYFSERVTIEDLEQSYPDTKHVIETFGCTSAKDYHDLYLCCDVMQLADVFDRSMNILWESHHIHLTKYIGMPSASWAAFLRHDPSLSIPLYEDTFFAEFFKEMIRGGITSAPLRHAVADENHSIIYLDVNGLYPYVMQKYKFPTGEFKLVHIGQEGVENCHRYLEEMFRRYEEDGNRGMCFCVDMHFPPSVKKLTDMYPFAPEHRKIYAEYFRDIDKKELTPFLQRWSAANNGDNMKEFMGLVCTLYDKEKYNVHWRLLQFYMKHGVEITKVHYGVSFSEGDYLAGYIRKNIEIRNTRKDELGKTLYKLLGNSIYGKTFESPFKRNTYEIVRDPIKLQGLLQEGNIASMVPIDDLGWIVKMDGDDIILDKPTYIGACVCEFSKLHMYTLLYDKLMTIFPDQDGEPGCQLVYTDTDSFIVRIRHPEGVTNDPKTLFDYIKSKDPDLIGGIGGQVKSETGEDDTIQEVIALRSKVYAYRTQKEHIGKRAKGTTYDAQETQLDWEVYKQALESLVSFETKNVQFVKKVFKVASLDVFRCSLSVNDGKRDICDDGIHTHAFGYFS